MTTELLVRYRTPRDRFIRTSHTKVLKEFKSIDIVNGKVQNSDIFERKNIKKQNLVAVLFTQLLEIKEKLIEEPGAQDTCTSASHPCNRDAMFTPFSIVCLSGNI